MHVFFVCFWITVILSCLKTEKGKKKTVSTIKVEKEYLNIDIVFEYEFYRKIVTVNFSEVKNKEKISYF